MKIALVGIEFLGGTTYILLRNIWFQSYVDNVRFHYKYRKNLLFSLQ